MLHPSVKEKQCHKDGLDGGVKNCHLDDDNKEQENNRDRLTDRLGKCIRSPLPKHVIGESVNALHHTLLMVLHLHGGGKGLDRLHRLSQTLNQNALLRCSFSGSHVYIGVQQFKQL